MSRSTRAAHGFAAGAFQTVAQIALQALLAPVVLRIAGRETLGAYAVLLQCLAYLALVDFGLSFSLERFLAQATGVDDGGAKFRQIFTTARTFFLATNATFAMLIWFVSLRVSDVFHLSPLLAHEARLSLWVIAGWAIVRTPLVAYNIAMVATQDMAAANLIASLCNIGRAVVSLAAVSLGFGLVGLMLAGTAAEAVGTLLYRRRFLRRNPNRRPGWGVPERTLLRDMLSFGGCVFVTNIAGMIVFNSGNLIVGYLFGVAAVSVFYTTQTPTVMGNNILLRLGDSVAPAVNESIGRGDVRGLSRIYVRVYRWNILLASFLALGVFLFNRDLVTCWVGKQQYGGRLLTVSLALFVAMVALEHVNLLFAFAFGWVRMLSAISILQAAANAVMAVVFGRYFGMGGVVLAVVVALLPKTLYLFHRIARELRLSTLSVLFQIVSPTLAPTVIAGLAGLGASYIPIHGWLHFTVEVIIFAAAFALVAVFFVIPDEDRSAAKNALAAALSAMGARSSPVDASSTVEL